MRQGAEEAAPASVHPALTGAAAQDAPAAGEAASTLQPAQPAQTASNGGLMSLYVGGGVIALVLVLFLIIVGRRARDRRAAQAASERTEPALEPEHTPDDDHALLDEITVERRPARPTRPNALFAAIGKARARQEAEPQTETPPEAQAPLDTDPQPSAEAIRAVVEAAISSKTHDLAVSARESRAAIAADFDRRIDGLAQAIDARLRDADRISAQKMTALTSHIDQRIDEIGLRLADGAAANGSAAPDLDALVARMEAHISDAFGERLETRLRARLESTLAESLSARLSQDLGDRISARLDAVETGAPRLDAALERFEARLAQFAQTFARANAGGAHATTPEAMARIEARLESLSASREPGAHQDFSNLAERLDRLNASLGVEKSAGIVGAVQLADVVRNAMPPEAYEFRVALSNERRADCLIKLANPPGPIVIDARFPVEAYAALRAAQNGAGRDAAADAFRRAALKHLVDVAERCIIPGETSDAALMFIPSEAIYTALHANFSDVIQDSFRARVWIVSPTTLMATLNTMRAILRDVKAREDATAVKAESARVRADVEALRARASELERHFDEARRDMRDLIMSTQKVVARADVMDGRARSIDQDDPGGGATPLRKPSFLKPVASGGDTPSPLR